MTTTVSELAEKGARAKGAARQMAIAGTAAKNAWLLRVAELIEERTAAIVEDNEVDYAEAKAAGYPAPFLDRMLLNPARLSSLAADVRSIAALSDPIGEMLDERTLANGLTVGRRRVPLGVIGSIYESRPNCTVDIAVLAVKAGNAALLRGGKECRRSNHAFGRLLRDAAAECGLPADCVQVVESTDRALVGDLLKMRDVIDLMVPRGSESLIRRVYAEATMPVVAGGIGVCHTFIDDSADLEMAVDVTVNAKTRRVSICNALDTILVSRVVAEAVLPPLGRALAAKQVELRCDPESTRLLKSAGVPTTNATEADFGKEFLDYVASVRVVDGLDGALAHIAAYGSGHTESIITDSYGNAERFLNEVDAAAVMVNASTQFTDGGQFGLGAEVGISTQKMHARGPLGLRELTSYKWIVRGAGHTRP